MNINSVSFLPNSFYDAGLAMISIKIQLIMHGWNLCGHVCLFSAGNGVN